MTEHYKMAVVKSLSEILPPFSESVVSLMEHVKNDGDYDLKLLEKLAETTYHSSRVRETLSKELERIQLELTVKENNVSSTNNKNELINIRLEMNVIESISKEALWKISGGVSVLIYLMAQDKGVLSDLTKKPAFQKLLDTIENPDINSAIDNLYQGAKKLTEIIDKVTDS